MTQICSTSVNQHSIFFFFRHFQALQEAIDAQEESLLWLKSRLAGLSEVSSELEVQRQRAALAKLSTDLRALFSSLCQVYIMLKMCFFSLLSSQQIFPTDCLPYSFTVG